MSLCATLAAGVGLAEKAGAGNLGYGMTCGLTPPAPNAVDTCSGWVPSNFAGYVYKIDATHHAGPWGGNWDPGTWHVIVYLYTSGGGYVQQEANFDVGDWGVPLVGLNPDPNTFGKVGILIQDSISATQQGRGFTRYRACDPNNASSGVYQTTRTDTAGVNWSSGDFWPFGKMNSGYTCQHGFGHHGGLSRTFQWGANFSVDLW